MRVEYVLFGFFRNTPSPCKDGSGVELQDPVSASALQRSNSWLPDCFDFRNSAILEVNGRSNLLARAVVHGGSEFSLLAGRQQGF